MQDFFAYRPVGVAFIIDIHDPVILTETKKAIIQWCANLESATEDKVYLYQPLDFDVPRWTGASIAAISDYRGTVANIEIGLKQSVAVLSKLDDTYKKTIFLVADHISANFVKKYQKGMHADVKYGSRCWFSVAVEQIVTEGGMTKNYSAVSLNSTDELDRILEWSHHGFNAETGENQ